MLSLMAALLMQDVPAPVSVTEAQEIVVVGRRLEEALQACIARDCPPAEEVELSLQASVMQFGGGRYSDARRTLQRAIRRNRQHAEALPGPVASLYATLSDVTLHDGRMDVSVRASRTGVELLRRHVGLEHRATLTEELAFADKLAGHGSPRLADRRYVTIHGRALASGYSDVAALASLRRAHLALAERRFENARARAADAAREGQADRHIVAASHILALRATIQLGDEAAVDRLALALADQSLALPLLIHAPPLPQTALNQGGISTMFRDGDIAYADVGFVIHPDGRVTDVEYLRGGHLGQFQQALRRHYMGRRYAPFAADGGTERQPQYRMERVTVRSEFGVPTGSRLPSRMGPPRIQFADLTAMQEMAAEAFARGEAEEDR